VQGFAYHSPARRRRLGGVPIEPQERALKAGVDIVVATPGRLLDHMRSNVGDYSALEIFVLDEADRMMDMGFWPDVQRICRRCRRAATLPSGHAASEIRMATEMLRPGFVQVGQRRRATITHDTAVESGEKIDWLAKFIGATPQGRCWCSSA
jgi:ATP-dependent RNA helicase RhlE